MSEDNGEQSEPQPCITAFLVIMRSDGICLATSDLNLVHMIKPEREATIQDFHRASGEVAKDVERLEIVNSTIAAFQELEEMRRVQTAQKRKHAPRKKTVAKKAATPRRRS